ncbi:DUF2500 domain-containing protein [Rossellomorea marisflavi]|jgi:Protein of unknown function (DUF2500)|uniref:DUF2500 domain-containing protein n=1 Tax=Rossellomorea marisflavi TaxID=189381 RepID=UPI00285312D4|nr:DUF2500 domain-containing protein [Rossellomorea marisflavi]MDR4938694.1 DUF2500 domain-containing protein [Rossellomorea marisflavi]
MGETGDVMFSVVPVIVGLGFIAVIGFVLFQSFKGVSEWNSNNQSPQQSSRAKLVSKRALVQGGAGEARAHTSYFMTFQFENGERTEMRVKGKEYGMLAEGDEGLLTFQGTRYLGFERNSE